MPIEHHIQTFAIAYDLSDDHERYRVDKVLQGWGHRVQKSVFMVRTNQRGANRLKDELERLELQTGSVLFFRMQNHVKVWSTGQPFDDPDDVAAYVV
jgi:CRISPR-associated protein Cas2